jgi:Fe2+-dicitrate sensor, membrane component
MLYDIPWQILEKYFASETNELENQQVEKWIDSAAENEMIFDQLQRYYKTSGSLPIEFIPDTEAALKKVSKETGAKSKILRLSSIWWKVAAVLLVAVSTWWFVFDHQEKNTPLAMAELKADADALSVVLSDGSHIWLNAHSSIKYPKKFGNTRNIYLDGEAYFEVAHDSKHPFIVHTPKTQTRVLGTKFNVRSYSSEKQIVVTVSEGKVGFGSAANSQVILLPNQKGAFDRQTGNVTKMENNDSNFMAWKTLEFSFDGETLAEVFKTLAEAYHFSYKFDSPDLKTRIVTANFSKRPLDEIMQTISLSANVQVSLQNGTYYIK